MCAALVMSTIYFATPPPTMENILNLTIEERERNRKENEKQCMATALTGALDDATLALCLRTQKFEAPYMFRGNHG